LFFLYHTTQKRKCLEDSVFVLGVRVGGGGGGGGGGAVSAVYTASRLLPERSRNGGLIPHGNRCMIQATEPRLV